MGHSFLICTIGLEWLKNLWGGLKIKIWGPLIKKMIMNFKTAAVEHDTKCRP